MAKKLRKIILGIEEPKKMKGKDIHITFSKSTEKGILFCIKSKKEFKYESNKSAKPLGVYNHPLNDNRNIVNDLSELNHAEVDYTPLIGQGLIYHSSLEIISDTLEILTKNSNVSGFGC